MRKASDVGFRSAECQLESTSSSEHNAPCAETSTSNTSPGLAQTPSDDNNRKLRAKMEVMSRQPTQKASNGINAASERVKPSPVAAPNESTKHRRSLEETFAAATSFFTNPSGAKSQERQSVQNDSAKNPIVLSLVSLLMCDDHGCVYQEEDYEKKKGSRNHSSDDSSVVEELLSSEGSTEVEEEDYADMLDRLLFRHSSLDGNSDEESIVEPEYTTDNSDDYTTESSTDSNYERIKKSQKASSMVSKSRQRPPVVSPNKNTRAVKQRDQRSKRSRNSAKKPCHAVRYDF
ncbi:hypothetical protein ACA910_001802 [Epithemia clementina (nom. ined.)]